MATNVLGLMESKENVYNLGDYLRSFSALNHQY